MAQSAQPGEVLREPDDMAARARRENFPVAARFLPVQVREHLLAVYGFARCVDDAGDEGPGDRLELLASLEQQLELAIRLRATWPVFVKLQRVIEDVDVDVADFRLLIEANRVDQVVSRYQTFEGLIGYCRLSAMPVGRIVLAVFESATPERVSWSDDVCAGLQIVEHLQDVREDALAGRIYLPLDDMATFGVSEEDLTATTASPALRDLVLYEAGRARVLLGSGRPLAGSLHGRARAAVAGFVAGGLAVVDSVERRRGDVLGHQCRPARRRLATNMASILTHAWRATPAAEAARAATGPAPAGPAPTATGSAPAGPVPTATGPARAVTDPERAVRS